MRQLGGVLISIWFLALSMGHQPFYDRTHFSRVFGETRHYRIFLPSDYETSKDAYPVIYYFHGHSDRYTLEKYDDGQDTVPKIAEYVAHHPVIVVSVDGYVARDYTGFYGGTPWDVRAEGGSYDFGEYFKELVEYIDGSYRTLTDRRHRATCGLSMGGFMSLYLSARYPQLIGSASAFNPGPEFYVGDKGGRFLWRPKDHVSNHGQTMVRLVRASGDYISQYHEETREAYARADDVNFEYRMDEYHRHWATSIAETFDFHQKAFGNSQLDNVPVSWSHDDAYKSFEVWGWRVENSEEKPCLTSLRDVSQGGFQITTRRWAPDGPAVEGCIFTVTTAPLYKADNSYTLFDHNLANHQTIKIQTRADRDGRIKLTVDGNGHVISFIGPGAGAQPPVLLPLTTKDKLLLEPEKALNLPIKIYNPRETALKNVNVVLKSEYPTVEPLKSSVALNALGPGAAVDLSDRLSARFTAASGYFAPVRLQLVMSYDGEQERSENIDVLVIPNLIPEPNAVEILDGRRATFRVFRQRGNRGGGEAIEREVFEGKGNGNGQLEPGEEATVWVKLIQGMDPFDKNTWHRCKIYSDSPWLVEAANLEETRQREWTSAQEKTSLIQLSTKAPRGTTIPLLLDNESWSFAYTPDVRYGSEKLYQAFQLHTHHLHRFELTVK